MFKLFVLACILTVAVAAPQPAVVIDPYSEYAASPYGGYLGALRYAAPAYSTPYSSPYSLPYSSPYSLPYSSPYSLPYAVSSAYSSLRVR